MGQKFNTNKNPKISFVEHVFGIADRDPREELIFGVRYKKNGTIITFFMPIYQLLIVLNINPKVNLLKPKTMFKHPLDNPKTTLKKVHKTTLFTFKIVQMRLLDDQILTENHNFVGHLSAFYS